MAEIVNFNRFKKQKSRTEKRQTADQNAVKFGLSKAEKDIERAKRDKDRRDLDGHERE